jgi:hypothetical protein
VILGMLVVATYLYALRSPTSITAPTLWAEGGTVFFKDAIERGWSALFAPYSGQLLLFPRLVATIVAPLPAAIQPALYAGVAMAVAVLSCGIVLSSRWRDAVPLSARFVCLLALLCAPGVDETYGTLANTHWWLGLGLLLLGMLRDPLTRGIRIGELAFAALAGTSGFAALYGIPALGVRAIRNRSRHSLTVLGIAVLGVIVQVGVLLGSARRGDIAGIVSDPLAAVLVFAKRVMATAAVGETNLAVLWPVRSPGAWALLAAILLTMALTLIWMRTTRMEMGALLLCLLGGWFLALWAMTQPDSSVEMLFWSTAAARFFLIPRATLYISLVVAWPFLGIKRAALALAGVLLLAGILSDYHLAASPTVDWGPFAQCVDQARADCSTVIPPGWSLHVDARGR